MKKYRIIILVSILILLISCIKKYKYKVSVYQPNNSFIYYYTNDITKDSFNCITFKVEDVDSVNFNEIGTESNLCTEYIIDTLR